MLSPDQAQPTVPSSNVHCYGRQAALCVEATRLPRSKQATVSLEIAPRRGEDMDWTHKIVLQLSDSELPLLCALLLGLLPKTHFKRPDKGIEIERQANHFYFKASAGSGRLYALPVTIGDGFRVSTLCLAQLQQQAHTHQPELVIAALRGAAALYQGVT